MAFERKTIFSNSFPLENTVLLIYLPEEIVFGLNEMQDIVSKTLIFYWIVVISKRKRKYKLTVQ